MKPGDRVAAIMRFSGGRFPMGLFAQPSTKAICTRRRVSAWLAVFALVLQTLLPVGQALALETAQDERYIVICTVNGIEQHPISQEGTPIVPSSTGPCSHCIAYGSVNFIAPLATASVILEPLNQPTAFVVVPQYRQVSIWRSQTRPSRAPPLFV